MRDESASDSLIENAVTRLLERHCTPEQLKAAEGTWNEGLWHELEDSGFARALLPGDADVPLAEALRIVRLAGRYGAPAPLVETLLVHYVSAAAELPAPEGPLSVAPVSAFQQPTLEPAGNSWRLSTTLARVPWGRYAAAVLVPVRRGDKECVTLLSAKALKVTRLDENLAREPRDTLACDVVVPAEAVAALPSGMLGTFNLGAALRVLQIAGALDRVLHLTVAYAQERKQFGRPIGKFQAIQQNIAILAAQVAASRAAANLMESLVGAGCGAYGVAAAKLRSNEAATVASKLAHQVHGAMGFTQEYPLHFATKRLWSWRDEFGSEAQCGAQLGTAARARGAQGLWEFITAELG